MLSGGGSPHSRPPLPLGSLVGAIGGRGKANVPVRWSFGDEVKWGISEAGWFGVGGNRGQARNDAKNIGSLRPTGYNSSPYITTPPPTAPYVNWVSRPAHQGQVGRGEVGREWISSTGLKARAPHRSAGALGGCRRCTHWRRERCSLSLSTPAGRQGRGPPSGLHRWLSPRPPPPVGIGYGQGGEGKR